MAPAREPPKSVCVIGAGLAGLCALRHLTSRLDAFGPIVCYEQTGQIGGTWNYTDKVGLEDNGLPVHTSMYRDLRTNAPSEIMDFPDFKYKYSCSYPTQEEVLGFFTDYTAHFSLRPYIHFEHHLQSVSRDQTNDCWVVTIKDMKAQRSFTSSFDVLLLAPGRNFLPSIPEIPGMKAFKGKTLHSHDYRSRQAYAGQKVAVIGAGPSGVDIALQTATVAKTVYLINRTENQFEVLPENLKQIKANVLQLTADSMHVQALGSGQVEVLPVDTVIFATGYRINLNFLDQEECGLRLNSDGTLDGIYRHLVNIRYPTMALLSIIWPTLNFPLYQQQILYYIKLILGEIRMPSKEEMLQEVQDEAEMRKKLGFRPAVRHFLRGQQMGDYLATLEADAHLPPTPPVLLSLMEAVGKARKHNPITFKEINYRIVDERTFEIR